MNAIATYRNYRRMVAAQWLDQEQIRNIQESKLRRLVRRAYATVPYYRTLLDDAGLSPEKVTGLDDLPRIPITKKRDLQTLPPDSLIDRTVNRNRLSSERTSGSSARPFTVFYDSKFHSVRNAMFLRALRSVGYRFGQKLLLVTTRRSRVRSRRLLRWKYAPSRETPERLLEEIRRFGPDWIYDCVTPLRLLAEEVARRSDQLAKPIRIVTTAETLDKATRHLLQRTFKSDVFQFYGLTEMGLVGWQCSEHNGYHLADDTVIVEQMPPREGEGPPRLVMTNLDSTVRAFTLLTTLEGRTVDCVQLRNGRRVSPYMLTCELEKLEGVGRYQIVQNEPGSLRVYLEPRAEGTHTLQEDIRRVLRAVVGEGFGIEVEINSKLIIVPGRKFRVVECRLEDRGSGENPVHEL
jgi:phenylacetate-CoA ligase